MKRALSGPRVRGPLRLAAALLLLLGGCGLLPGEGPPPRLFTPHPKVTFAADLPKVDWQLEVEMPTAPGSLDTVRIALQQTPVELNYYEHAAWSDVLPAMVQTLLVSSFENTGKIVAVGREAAGLRADFLLKTDIRDFEVESAAVTGGKPEARVRIVSKLVKMPDRMIVSDLDCDYKQPADSETLEAIVGAYTDVLGRCMRRIVEWTLHTGNQERPKN